MTVYEYNKSDKFPSLKLEVKISNYSTNESVSYIAKLDTGAELTKVPEQLRDTLNLEATGEVDIVYGNGHWERVKSYLVTISLNAHRIAAEAYFRNSQYVLIGRNVLNQMVLHCDGIRQKFWIDDPE